MSVKQKDQLMSALAEANNSTGIFTKSEVLKIASEAGLSKPMWFFKEQKLVAISSILQWLVKLCKCQNPLK